MTTFALSALAEYEKRTPQSRALYERARKIIPGGVSRGTLAFEPYPFYAAEASGAEIRDVDGNRYLDFINNYTSLPHGHGHGPTTEAVIAQLRSSSAVGTAHELEAEYAQSLCDRLPALEWTHFTTTGSEAVGFAVRVARAATGRSRILKFEGGFHGSHNELYQDIALLPALPPGSARAARPSSAGLEPTGTITAPYNDSEAVRYAFSHWGADIAAVVLEPFLGNAALIPAQPAFLDAVFESARLAGALVVFDEVQSMRAGLGGAHARWGYRPDLLAIGKIIGGGHPLAAFGGRSDLASVLGGGDSAVLQTGTFTATPVALAAGHAAMQCMTAGIYDELEIRTERLRVGTRQAFGRAKIGVHVNGLGSMFNIAISDEPVDTYQAHRRADSALLSRLRLEMLVRGFLIMPRGTGCLSTAVTDDHIAEFLAALDASLAAIRSE